MTAESDIRDLAADASAALAAMYGPWYAMAIAVDAPGGTWVASQPPGTMRFFLAELWGIEAEPGSGKCWAERYRDDAEAALPADLGGWQRSIYSDRAWLLPWYGWLNMTESRPGFPDTYDLRRTTETATTWFLDRQALLAHLLGRERRRRAALVRAAG